MSTHVCSKSGQSPVVFWFDFQGQVTHWNHLVSGYPAVLLVFTAAGVHPRGPFPLGQKKTLYFQSFFCEITRFAFL